MYVVKVGEYYVRSFMYGELTLSNEIMRGFEKEQAESLAKLLNGVVVCLRDPLGISEEVE